jgi:2,3-bisphosphoglycerate-independent phosphoglycerate mutase
MCADHPAIGGSELADLVRELYSSGQTDYSIEPIILADAYGKPIGRIRDGDAVIFCLRRGEREVQLTEAFVSPEVGNFPREDFKHLAFVILTLYHEKFKDLPVAFAPTKITNTLAETISRAGLRQMHISESEKYAHVTFFFNGGTNLPFAGEDDVQVSSLRGIPPEEVPELCLEQVAQQVVEGINNGIEMIVVNFANGDVIGHTQSVNAKIKCAEGIDRNLHKVVEAAISREYVVIITADHGNLEELYTLTPHVSYPTRSFILIAQI